MIDRILSHGAKMGIGIRAGCDDGSSRTHHQEATCDTGAKSVCDLGEFLEIGCFSAPSKRDCFRATLPVHHPEVRPALHVSSWVAESSLGAAMRIANVKVVEESFLVEGSFAVISSAVHVKLSIFMAAESSGKTPEEFEPRTWLLSIETFLIRVSFV